MNILTIFLGIILVILILFLILSSIGSFRYAFYVPSAIKSAIYAFIISSIIIYTTLKQFSMVSILALIILTFIFYLIFSQMKGDNNIGALPSSSYPPPPHLGLDGISLENTYSGM